MDAWGTVVTLHHLKERSHSSRLPSSNSVGLSVPKWNVQLHATKKLQLSLVCQHRPYNTAGTHELLFWVNGVTEVKLQLCRVPLLCQHFPLLPSVQYDTHYCLWGKQRREKLCCHSRCTLIWLQGGLGCFHWLFLPRIWLWVVVELLSQGCDLFPLKCLVLCKSEHSEHCGYGTALPGFSTHLCSPWASHAPHQSFFSGKWSKKVTNVWLCLILTKPLYEMQYEDREGSTCVATHAATLAPDSEKERPSLQGQVKDAANCSQWEPWVYNEKELLRGLQHLCSISHQFSEVQGQVGSAGARLLLNLPPILVLPQFFGLKFLIIWFLLFIPLSALDIMSQFMLGNLSLFVSWDHKLI